MFDQVTYSNNWTSRRGSHDVSIWKHPCYLIDKGVS